MPTTNQRVPIPENLYAPGVGEALVEVSSQESNGVLYAEQMSAFRDAVAGFVAKPARAPNTPASDEGIADPAISRKTFRISLCGTMGSETAIDETIAALTWFRSKADEIDPRHAALFVFYPEAVFDDAESFRAAVRETVRTIRDESDTAADVTGTAIHMLGNDHAVDIDGETLFALGFHPGAGGPAFRAPVPMIAWFPLTQFERLPTDEQFARAKQFANVYNGDDDAADRSDN